ncbi:MAG: hypothetical protein WCG75_05205, partial [Armatimonadota bacterium]
RLFDKQSVVNFGISWELKGLAGNGLKFSAGLDQPRQWQTDVVGNFEAGFGVQGVPHKPRFHVPFILMAAGQEWEFRKRHKDPATPERIASWVEMCLNAYNDGKCDGVVTYCLDKTKGAKVFDLVRLQLMKHKVSN